MDKLKVGVWGAMSGTGCSVTLGFSFLRDALRVRLNEGDRTY
ncbi:MULTISPECIES: hypothetical protein [Nostocales]|nr:MULTISPECIES: hypothetical protein [Nostocales]